MPGRSFETVSARPAATNWAAVGRHGLIGGLLSGLVFSGAVSVAAMLQNQSWAAPVRLIAAVALGRRALEPDQPLLAALTVGMGLHLLYTVATGLLFAWLVATWPGLRRSGRTTLVAALVYTLVLWLVGFYVIAPLLGWRWFPERTEFLSQFVLQVGFWGGALGAYFALPPVRAQLGERAERRLDD